MTPDFVITSLTPRLFPSRVVAAFLKLLSKVIRLKIPLNVLDIGDAMNLRYVCLFNHIRFHCIFDSEINVDLCTKINGIRKIYLFQDLSFKFFTVQLTELATKRSSLQSSFRPLLWDLLDLLGATSGIIGGLLGTLQGMSGCLTAAGRQLLQGSVTSYNFHQLLRSSVSCP